MLLSITLGLGFMVGAIIPLLFSSKKKNKQKTKKQKFVREPQPEPDPIFDWE